MNRYIDIDLYFDGILDKKNGSPIARTAIYALYSVDRLTLELRDLRIIRV